MLKYAYLERMSNATHDSLMKTGTNMKYLSLKGSLTRDFRLQVYFMNQFPPGPGPPIIPLGSFKIFPKNRIDTGNFVNDTTDKLFAIVNDTGYNYRRCRCYWR